MRRTTRTLTSVTALWIGLSLSLPSAADELIPAAEGASEAPIQAPLPWQWRRAHFLDYAATAALAGVALTAELVPHQGPPQWVGAELFDGDVRDALVLGSFDDRQVAARISDVTIAALVAQPVLVDAVLVTWLGYDAGDTAWQLLVMDLEILAFNFAFTGAIKRLADRERPSATACRTDPRYDPRCEDQSAHNSFFSGHTSLAFTAAALTCSHHARLGLFGVAGDTLACVGTTFGAATVAVERIVADRHYATDVIVGAAAGIASGALLPWALFFAHEAGDEPAITWRAVPWSPPGGAGLALTGLW